MSEEPLPAADPASDTPATGPAADTPPDRLSINPRSPHFDGEVLGRGVGIRFNGQERTQVEEYSVSEGWIRLAAGNSRDRFGNPMTIKVNGTVEPYYRDIQD